MNDKNMKVSDISKISGIPYSTVKSILEKGIEKASYINICKICSALDITSDDLEKMVKDETVKSSQLTQEDFSLIKKYHSLDSYGQETIEIILDREAERVQQLKNRLNAYEKGLNKLRYNKSEDNCLLRVAESPVTYGVNAAHERTDINITEEMQKHDDDIMDDDNF